MTIGKSFITPFKQEDLSKLFYKQIQAVDFMTIEQSREYYKSIEVVVTESHGLCPECMRTNHPNIDLKKIYPNYLRKKK